MSDIEFDIEYVRLRDFCAKRAQVLKRDLEVHRKRKLHSLKIQ